MSTRSYRQTCGVACALDLLGERWTLLVVRELLLGPKRFGALAAALPGMSSNLLSARLQALAGAGLAEQVRLPPPADNVAYALTERGEDLRPAVEALARWGFVLLEPEAQHDEGWLGRGSWLAFTLAAAVDDEPEERLTADFDVDGDRFTIRLDDGRARVRHGVSDAPDGSLTCTLPGFFVLACGLERSDDPALDRLFGVLAPHAAGLSGSASKPR